MQIPLNADLREHIRQCMVAGDHSSPQSAILEIIEMSRASTPMDGAITAGRQQAYREMMRMMLSRVQVFISELKQDAGVKADEVRDDEPGVF